MPYNRIERRVAALLDSFPAARRFAKAGYQRLNYLLQGQSDRKLRLHAGAVLQRLPGLDHRQECFFGYFGECPWSRDGNFFLFHQWDQRRDAVDICMYDYRAAASRVLARSAAWNFQQGSMAQWLHADDGVESVIFNDGIDRTLGCRIVSLNGRERHLAWPIQAVHPEGRVALSLNYKRLALVQPEYGYGADVSNFTADQPPDRDGIWRLDLRAGGAELIVSLVDLLKVDTRREMREAAHSVNHAVYSPSGDRFVFMHRWLGPPGMFSRLYCAEADGSGLRLLLDHRMVSHYAWRDDRTLLAWARTPEGGDRYYLLDVSTGDREVCCAEALDRFGDGHPSFSPDGQWIVTDTYPDRARMRRLLLCRPRTRQMIEVGAFHSPWRYEGARRCDLHPRWNANGRVISIDSAHEGIRSTYTVDVSRIVSDAR